MFINTHKMHLKGVDSFNSWLAAFSCGVVHLMVAWPMRLGSILFVEMIDRYDVNRRGASLPFALLFCLRSASSPFAGYFGNKFGLQQVTMFGCVLCSVGVGLCFFSEEIISINIFLGLIYGFGLGWSSCLLPEIINRHFTKHRAKSYSLSIGISGVLVFMTSPVLELILDGYGVSGTFLIMSAIIFNSVPAAMLLREPDIRSAKCVSIDHKIEPLSLTDKKEPLTFKTLNSIPSPNSDFAIAINTAKPLKSALSDDPNFNTVVNDCPAVNSEEPGPSEKHTHVIEIKNIKQSDHEINTGNAIQIQLQGMSATCLRNKASKELYVTEEVKLHVTESKDKQMEEVSLDSVETVDKKSTKKIDSDLNKNKDLSKSIYKSIDILWHPLFLFITFIQSSHFYVLYVSWTITVDLVRDKNIAQYLEVYFVMALALLDTVGRTVLGFVTDNKYTTAGNCCALCFCAMGLSCLLLVWVSGFLMTLTAICIFGFLCGANTMGLPGIVTEFIEKDKRTMAMASRLILYAPMSFTMSPLIGYFRGVLGTYDGLLYSLAALCLFCSIALVLLPRLKLYIEQKKVKS